MEGRYRDKRTVGRAAQVIAERGRLYKSRRGYVSLVVFSTEITTLDLLERCFGGGHYKHRAGYIWVASRRGILRTIISDLREHVPESDLWMRIQSFLPQ